MNADARQHLGWGSRLRLGMRMLGVTALPVVGIGALILGSNLPEWDHPTLRAATHGEFGQTVLIGAWMLVVGLALAASVVVIELLVSVFGSGRRSAAGFNAGVQTLLAVAILAAVNFLAFGYPKRWDLTRHQEFTLPKDVTGELKNLKGRTTVVVLQLHKTFGQFPVKTNLRKYENAAERKVIEKVRDVVDQFREIGPQFSVVSLDVEAIDFDDMLKQETKRRPGLLEAINAAPENSIFFYADDRVETLAAEEVARRQADGRKLSVNPADAPGQSLTFEGTIPRMSFNQFYMLDINASRNANPDETGKAEGNLVLHPQGVESFARRVLSIQEKKPKVALMTIHEVLTTNPSEGTEEFTAHGLRKSLEEHGFEVVDLLMKRWPPREAPSPAAYNMEETTFDSLASELDGIEDELRTYREEEEQAGEFRKLFKEKSLEELNKRLRNRIRREVTEEFRQRQLQVVEDALKRMAERIAELEKDRLETEAKVQALIRKERPFEDRRVTDIKAKMTRLVADCDLLIIPRHTVLSAASQRVIDPTLYKLSKEQVDVVRDFLASGRPVLACLGPNNDSSGPLNAEPLDDFERLLGDVGIDLGRQTVLFDSEMKAFASRKAGNQFGGGSVEIPPLSFPPAAPGKKPNPIARAMQAVANSADQSLELRIRYPRPVYLSQEAAAKLPFTPDILQTSSAAWNEEQPFPNIRQVGAREVAIIPPRFEATPFDDPKKGTRDEERRGPFPVAVALETAIPLDWYENDGKLAGQRIAAAVSMGVDGGLGASLVTASSLLEKDRRTLELIPRQERKTTRLAVIGNGGLFNGSQLSPANEQLLLHSCNWLLQREDRLPRMDADWAYPRAEMSPAARFYWQRSPVLGLPALFLYVGVMVLMIRRVR